MALMDVLLDEMRDLYSAENQLVKALPKVIKGNVGCQHEGWHQEPSGRDQKPGAAAA